jgi:hypothetical protein
MFKIRMCDATKEYAKMALTVTGAVAIGYVLLQVISSL